jgi:putative ABC transport system permease protein
LEARESERSKSVETFSTFRLALRLLAREWRAGEWRVLLAALVVAVGSLSSVNFFTDRVRQALALGANQLLGADLVVMSTDVLPPRLEEAARAKGLRTTRGVRFPTMVTAKDQSLLAEARAVEAGYPLRGRLRLRDAGGLHDSKGPPARGEMWIDERLAARMNLGLGDRLSVGAASLRVAGIVTEEPESSSGFMNMGPKVVLNYLDLDSTQLIRTGSRASWRLFVAGDADAVVQYRSDISSRLTLAQKMEDVRDARPEIRTALNRAERFLGLAALLSTVLAGVAVALAARRHLDRHLDGCAVMRALGATQSQIFALHVWQLGLLGVVASALGVALGYAAQHGLSLILAPLVAVELPRPGWTPLAQGFAVGTILLLGFVLPPLLALRRVPTVRVLRRDMGAPDGWQVLVWIAAAVAVSGLVFWQAQDAKLAGYVLAGVAGLACLAALLAVGGIAFAALLARRTPVARFAFRFGVANLRRRRAASALQIVAIALGLMALILLTLVREDLLANWRKTVPADAPNRFLVQIQPEQLPLIKEFFVDQGMTVPAIFPMTRGRLVEINGQPVRPEQFADERARRLVEREFNLSWAAEPGPGNTIVTGNWFSAADHGAAVLSVEEGLAQTLGVHLGDELTYDVAGTRVSARVSSLRKVEWDSFQVNFFVVAPPGLLERFPTSFVSSFHLPLDRGAVMDHLVQAYPNLLVIDVSAILAQIRHMIDDVVKAVEFVFMFSLVAGLLVLVAAVSATRDERVYDAAVLRSLGASLRQVRWAQWVEFSLTGAIAGGVAAVGATGIGYFLALKVFAFPYAVDYRIWLMGLLAGAAVIGCAGLAVTWWLAAVPPAQVFRNA